MKPPFAYFGGKSRLAPWIVSSMPKHRVYIEPFAGSAPVLFEKAPCQHEIINDASGAVINFFTVLRERPEDLERAVSLTPYARDESEACTDYDDPLLDPLERARRWWMRSTQGFGQSPVKTGWSVSTNQNTCRPRHLMTRIQRFAPAADRLRGVFIESIDAVACIDRYGVSDAVIYADPPYLDVTRTSFNDHNGDRKRPSGDYEVEFNSEDDHRALAKALNETPATVLLSGYPSELYDELYEGWGTVTKKVFVHTSQAVGQTTRPTRTEVVWCNRALGDGQLFSHDVAAAT